MLTFLYICIYVIVHDYFKNLKFHASLKQKLERKVRKAIQYWPLQYVTDVGADPNRIKGPKKSNSYSNVRIFKNSKISNIRKFEFRKFDGSR